MKTCIIIGAGGRGKDAYAPYIQSKGLFKIIGVVEPDAQKRSARGGWPMRCSSVHRTECM